MTDQDWQSTLNSAWFIVLGILITAGVLVTLILKIAKSSSSRIQAREKALREAEEAIPRCPCGEYATHPAPFLAWERTGFGAWLRALHGAPPKYTLKVDGMRPVQLCPLHARVADATLLGWIFGVRTRYAELNQKVAVEAASFEQEGLAKAIADSLTDAQKRASKRPSAVIARITPRGGGSANGTDDSAGLS